MWRLSHLNSLLNMSRMKRYLISIGLAFVGLVFGVALFGAALLSAY